MRGLIRKADIVLVACLILAAPLVWAVLPRSSETGSIAVVRQAGVVLAEIDFRFVEFREYEFETSFGRNVIRIEDGAISMICADCPDGWCIRFAPIRHTRRTIVCLPNRFIVEILSDGSVEDAPDAVVY